MCKLCNFFEFLSSHFGQMCEESGSRSRGVGVGEKESGRRSRGVGKRFILSKFARLHHAGASCAESMAHDAKELPFSAPKAREMRSKCAE